MKHQHAAHGQHSAQGKGHYLKLAAMIGLSFVAMYVLMYAMVDRLANVYNNVNQFCMAGLMVAPMLVIELASCGTCIPTESSTRLCSRWD